LHSGIRTINLRTRTRQPSIAVEANEDVLQRQFAFTGNRWAPGGLLTFQGGELRQTVFLGWRDDKKAKEVVLERQ
jgi:hypothetical protein